MTRSSLLPSNATKLEDALAVAAARVAEIPVVADSYVDPFFCPEELLGWLAHDVSVDFWDPDWSEDTKRKVIASSWEIHQRKGTFGAVRAALGALEIKVDLEDARQSGGPPLSFSVIAAVSQQLHNRDVLIDEKMIDQVRSVVDATKRRASYYNLTVAAHFSPNTFGMAAAVGSAHTVMHTSLSASSPARQADAAEIALAAAVGSAHTVMHTSLSASSPARQADAAEIALAAAVGSAHTVMHTSLSASSPARQPDAAEISMTVVVSSTSIINLNLEASAHG